MNLECLIFQELVEELGRQVVLVLEQPRDPRVHQSLPEVTVSYEARRRRSLRGRTIGGPG